jgi:ATP-dependent DNA helicase RecG
MSKRKIAHETRKRLELMTSTTDGFLIAEADLKTRGPGDLEGTMQSGMPMELHVANLATDGQIIQLARDTVDTLLSADPALSAPGHEMLLPELSKLFSRKLDMSRIS